MTPLYYDKQGHPYDDVMAWAEKLEDLAYKRVAETILPNGRWVSTVWLGIDHQFGEGPPLIFETMVFASPHDSGELDMARYATEAEARHGHTSMCAKWEREP